jgi:hypothetical protein
MSVQSVDLNIFNRLGDASQVTNSERGVNGLASGVTYAPLKFGNGVDVDANNECVDFSYSFPNAGTIQLWMKPHFSSASTTLARFIDQATGGTTRIQFIWLSGSGLTLAVWGANIITYLPTFSVDDEFHVGLVWDTAGIDGTSDTARIYYQGVDVASGTTAIVPLTQTDLRIGCDSNGVANGNAVFDDFKTWDYAKIDFSDRFFDGFSNANKIQYG